MTAEYRNKTHIYPRYPQIQLLLLLLSIRWSCVCRFSGFYFFPLLLLPNLFHSSSSSCCDWPHKLKCFTTCHSYKSTHGLVENIHHNSKAPLEEAASCWSRTRVEPVMGCIISTVKALLARSLTLLSFTLSEDELCHRHSQHHNDDDLGQALCILLDSSTSHPLWEFGRIFL